MSTADRTELVRLDIDPPVALVTLDRADRLNALTYPMIASFRRAIDTAVADTRVVGIVVTGAGRAFSAGLDVADLARAASTGTSRGGRDAPDPVPDPDELPALFSHLLRVPKPVIAAVNGACMAGGMETLLGTDIRIAVPHATFALPEAVRGVIPFAGALVRLPRQIPYALAMEMMLTGTAIDAPTALNAGLIGRIVEPGALMETAMAMARKVAANAPVAVQQIKRTVIAASGVTLAEGYEMEDRAKRVVMSTEDAREGPRAFMEKRPAVYRGC